CGDHHLAGRCDGTFADDPAPARVRIRPARIVIMPAVRRPHTRGEWSDLYPGPIRASTRVELGGGGDRRDRHSPGGSRGDEQLPHHGTLPLLCPSPPQRPSRSVVSPTW